MEKYIDELFEYAVSVRRHIHRFPETGFELEKTVDFVSGELDKMGIGYTYKYGKGSICAEIGKGEKIIALRADMDALPIEERTGLPFSSEIKGKMHACGHDAHTAILLASAKYLKMNEEKLPCKVRFIFQPSEECEVSGAKMMVDNGVLEGVDHILCTHCENLLEAGEIGVCEGNYMAACVPLNIRFYGKTSHATLPQFGVDANLMSIEAWQKIRETFKKEAGDIPYILNLGKISGGTAHNIVSDFCELNITFRFYDMDFAERVRKKVFEICKSVSLSYGGKVEVDWNMSTGPVCNDGKTVKVFSKVAKDENFTVKELQSRMSSEDFGWYLTKVPGMLFRFGTKEKNCENPTVAHNSDFIMDENGMKNAIVMFCKYIMNCEENKYGNA